MNKLINKINYESYYLDFLEGNLDDDLVIEMTAFLDAHPDLIIDEELPSIQTNLDTLDTSFKNDLKIIELDETVNSTNASNFIIAKHEQLLSDSKVKELDKYIIDHNLETEDQTISKVYFRPDTTTSYPNKKALKKKQKAPIRTILFYAAAACLLLLFSISFFNSNGNQDLKSAIKTNNKLAEEPKSKENKTVTKTNSTPLLVAATPIKKNRKSTPKKTERRARQQTETIRLKTQQAHSIPNDIVIGPIEVSEHVKFQETPETPNSDLTFHNPIEPVTSFISEKTNINIDYKQSAKNHHQKRDFKLKIGRFSLSKKRGI